MIPSEGIDFIIKTLFNKETVFFGLFLVGYYLQNKDKNDLKDTNKHLHGFITEQQGVLKDITKEVGNIARAQEKHGERLERIEAKLNSHD